MNIIKILKCYFGFHEKQVHPSGMYKNHDSYKCDNCRLWEWDI